uniref:ABCA1-4-like C-terminal R2 regulatory domain-containing protein n=1 Tax=Pectinophora gossypiella TaxID=13191 RepID=A0A1E1WJI6_PECGO
MYTANLLLTYVRYFSGFTLTIKIKVDDETKTVRPEVCDAVKHYVSTNFREPKIMEEYQGLLTYYLPDKSVAWSRMFGIMEAAKRDLPVEDYSISQTTLEQIFLQFTKYQHEAQQT